MFKIEFETDNAAFEDAPHIEIARILRDVARRLDNDPLTGAGGVNYPVRDDNGNTVGVWIWRAD